MDLKFIRFPSGEIPGKPRLEFPTYATPGAAGLDLQSAFEAGYTIMPGEVVAFPTGFGLALPDGVEAQIRPRSGLAAKHGITVLNTPGTIDPDYRGEIKAILINHGSEPVTIRRGDRIAQMVLSPIIRATHFTDVSQDIPATQRGAGGLGSTGR